MFIEAEFDNPSVSFADSSLYTREPKIAAVYRSGIDLRNSFVSALPSRLTKREASGTVKTVPYGVAVITVSIFASGRLTFS